MANYRFRQRINNAAYKLPSKANRNLSHLPGPKANWLSGQLPAFLRNDVGYIAKQVEEHGRLFVFPSNFGKKAVVMVGPEANKMVLGNASKSFSNYHGYKLLRVFAGESVVTRDFEDHYELRKLLAQSFTRETLSGYFADINRICTQTVDQLSFDQKSLVEFYPCVKNMALKIAAKVFADLDFNKQHLKISNSLKDILYMSNAGLPIAIPGTVYARGLSGRRYVEKFFRPKIAERRVSEKKDFFTRLCTVENERSERLSDDEIIDNAIGVMIAGHDTSTIAMSGLAYTLAKHPNWQDVLAQQCQEIYAETGSKQLPFEFVDRLDTLDACIKEVLRIYTPIRYFLRRTVKEVSFEKYLIPKNTAVLVSIHHTHHSSDYFEQPESFEPKRFIKDSNLSQSNPYAWAPFGKGAHICLGMQFTMLEIKAFVYQLLLKFKLDVNDDYQLHMTGLPVSKPRDGVPIIVSPR